MRAATASPPGSSVLAQQPPATLGYSAAGGAVDSGPAEQRPAQYAVRSPEAAADSAVDPGLAYNADLRARNVHVVDLPPGAIAAARELYEAAVAPHLGAEPGTRFSAGSGATFYTTSPPLSAWGSGTETIPNQGLRALLFFLPDLDFVFWNCLEISLTSGNDLEFP